MSSVGRRTMGRMMATVASVLAMGNLFGKNSAQQLRQAEPLIAKNAKPWILNPTMDGGFGDNHPIKRCRPRKHISRAAKMKHKMRKKYNY